MAPQDQNHLFRRYAETGEPDLLAEVFDAKSGSLLRLALHLTSREADSEDLLQATFLTAIENAKRFDGDRPLLPWLSGILVNHAKRLSRRKPTAIAKADPTYRPHFGSRAGRRGRR